MDPLDEKIRKALAESAEPPESSQTTLATDVVAIFKGKMRWLLVGAWIKMGVVTIMFFVAIYQFFQQDSVMGMIAWATAVIVSVVTMASIYIFSWISLNHHETRRELKRLELQIALLSPQRGDH